MLSRVLQEWVLKRLYRMVLKPVLGKILHSDLDLAQLDVQFLNGTVELRDLVLDAEYVSSLVDKYGFRVLEGYIGYVRAEIPYYALSSSQIVIGVDEIRLKLEPTEGGDPLDAGAAESGGEGFEAEEEEEAESETDVWDSSSEDDEDNASTNQKSVIRSSIEMIAGGLEDFLQKLKIDCTSVSIEVVCPWPSASSSECEGEGEWGEGPCICTAIHHLSYQTKSSADLGGEEAAAGSRQISFGGLSIALKEEGKPTWPPSAAMAAADPASASDDEFHDAVGSPTSVSAESSPHHQSRPAATGDSSCDFVEILGSKEEGGLGGLVTIREEHAKNAPPDTPHITSIQVQVGSPLVQIKPKVIQACLSFADAISGAAASEWAGDGPGAETEAEARDKSEAAAAAIDSVLFPDCKSIAADILPAFFSKAAEGEDLETPAEAVEMAASVEEFFDANSRMTTTAGASIPGPVDGGAKAMSSTLLRIHHQDRGSCGRDAQGRDLELVVSLSADDLALEVPLGPRAGSGEGEEGGASLCLRGVKVTKHKFASGMEVEVSVGHFGVACYGIDGVGGVNWGALRETLGHDLPPSVGGVSADQEGLGALPCLRGRPHHTILSNFASPHPTRVCYKSGAGGDGEGRKGKDQGAGSRQGKVVRASLQPFWVLADTGTLEVLAPHLERFGSEVASLLDERERSGEPGSCDAEVDSKGPPTYLVLDSELVRIVGAVTTTGSGSARSASAATPGEILRTSILILDVSNDGTGKDLLSVSLGRQVEVEGAPSDIKLSFFPSLSLSQPCSLVHLSSGRREGSSDEALRVVCALRPRDPASAAKESHEDLPSSCWDDLNQRWAEGGCPGCPTRGDHQASLKDFYLQEKAIGSSEVFVHLVCANTLARVARPGDWASLIEFIEAYSALGAAEARGEEGEAREGREMADVTLLVEASATMEVPSPANPAEGGRFYGLDLERMRFFCFHSPAAQFSMAHFGVQDASVFARRLSREERNRIVDFGPNIQCSFAVRKDSEGSRGGDKGGPRAAMVALIDVQTLAVTLPTFLLDDSGGDLGGTLVDDACSLLTEPAADDAPIIGALKVFSRPTKISLSLEIPPCHDALEDLSLCRTQIECKLGVHLDLAKRQSTISLTDSAFRLNFRDQGNHGKEVFRAEKVAVILDSAGAAEGSEGRGEGERTVVRVTNDGLRLVLNEETVTGCFQLAEYVLGLCKSRLGKSSGKCGAPAAASPSRGPAGETLATIAAHRRSKMTRLRMERKLSRGSDTPWVILDDAQIARKDSTDSQSGFTDIEIEGYAQMYAKAGQLTMIEDYIPVPESREDESTSEGAPFAGRPLLAQGYPPPLLTLTATFRAIQVVLETATASAGVAADAPPNGCHTQGGAKYQIQCNLTDLGLHFDRFGESDDCAWRACLSIKRLEALEVLRNKAVPILELWESKQCPIEDGSHALRVEGDLRRPDPLKRAEDEMRSRVAMLPLRARLNPNVVVFLTDLTKRFAAKFLHLGEGYEDFTLAAAEEAPPDCVYVKSLEVSNFIVRLDYSPQRIHVSTKRGGPAQYSPVLNIVPLSGVELVMRAVSLEDTCGLSSCASEVGGEWLHHVAKYQAGKFVAALSPLKSIFSVGAGAKKLITLPLEEYKKEEGGSLAVGLRKGAQEFLHAVSLEVLMMGANIAGLSEMLLERDNGEEDSGGGGGGGGAGAEDSSLGEWKRLETEAPADLRRGLEQASTRLSAGISAAAELMSEDHKVKGVLKAGGALAGAIKILAVGARNSLDPELRDK